MPSPKPNPLTFQELILRLQTFWAERGCVLQQPYDVEVGAGTMAPETFLRVLGPQPYKVAYVQPSRRPADGRYGENPNRLFKHMQLQVILKPPPENVQELYLESLGAMGIDLRQHDIKFEEDNWESPTLGAWGIGWQVMLDGLEITQFTYFQQCGGVDLDPISAELTYGLERIASFLQDKDSIYDIVWARDPENARVTTYGDVRLADELQFSVYNFELADVEKAWKHSNCARVSARRCWKSMRHSRMRRTMELDATNSAFPLLAAYDLCLKCSHLFNILDARGAISVTERVGVIARVRALAVGIAKACVDQQRAELPSKLEREPVGGEESKEQGSSAHDGVSIVILSGVETSLAKFPRSRRTPIAGRIADSRDPSTPQVRSQASELPPLRMTGIKLMPDFLLEIGCEEIPARMIDAASLELRERLHKLLDRERLLPASALTYLDTPRRLAVLAANIPAVQPEIVEEQTGPSVAVAFKDGQPTPAAHAFAKKAGVEVSQLQRVTTAKGEYLSAVVRKKGRSAAEILAEALPKEIASIYWPKNMYWRKPSERFVRPVRWLVAMLDGDVIPLEFDGVRAGNQSRGHRILADGSVTIPRAGTPMSRLWRKPGFSVASREKNRFAKLSMPRLAPFPARAGAKTSHCWTPWST